MGGVSNESVGILPPGALGVAFFFHLTRELAEPADGLSFFERPGSRRLSAWQSGGKIRIQASDGIVSLSAERLFPGSLTECWRAGTLPEVILIAVNPDQLFSIVSAFVELVEEVYRVGELEDVSLPSVILCSNGIYFQRVRQVLVEKLEESTLLGRLPDLWPEIMPKLVGCLLRGVTIQTGLRDGSGTEAVYRPGPASLTLIAGGDNRRRERAVDLLAKKGGVWENAGKTSPTQAEFDKALTNLVANLLGLLCTIDSEGRFEPQPVGHFFQAERFPEIRELTSHVVRTGQAVRAYPTNYTPEEAFDRLCRVARLHGEHIPSSLQWLEQQINLGRVPDGITPTEEWLLNPLIHYARNAGLPEAADYFSRLGSRLEEALKLVRAHYGRSGHSHTEAQNETECR